MRLLFSALHLAYFRNFESAIRELAARGHHVHLAGDEPERLGGQELAERLAAECGTEGGAVTWDLLPTTGHGSWSWAARKLRLGLDYVRALEPRYERSRKLRVRAHERTPRIVRWTSAVPRIGQPITQAALTQIERLLPRSAAIEEYLRRHRPDAIVLTSLTYSRSYQFEMLKAARALRVPVGAAIMSWDHLSSKALLHLAPDMVVVWNDVQRREAVEMHGLPFERVVITGAQCYDQWFTRSPSRSRDEFCRAMGLRADVPFVLWVHSALSPTPVPPEPELVVRWIEALRASPNPRLRELGVLVRPHPERMKEWKDIQLDRDDNVAFHGRNPIDGAAKDDYFDSLYHSAAVIGLVTSAFLEAAVVGRPVLTFTLPEYRMHQEEMLHFQYLRTVEGGLLHSAPDLGTHLAQLSEAVARGGGRDERNQRFVRAFIRPAGLDSEATPRFADAIEALARGGSFGDRSLERHAWLRPVVGALAGRARRDLFRWLMLDLREDEWVRDRRRSEREQAARVAAFARHRRKKARRRARIAVRDWLMLMGKRAKHAFLWSRHRVAVLVYRGLILARLRGGLPGEK